MAYEASDAIGDAIVCLLERILIQWDKNGTGSTRVVAASLGGIILAIKWVVDRIGSITFASVMLLVSLGVIAYIVRGR